MLRKLWKDECGAVISAELCLVLTIAVLAMIVGLSEVAMAVNTELNDVSNAIGHLNQSYGFSGFHAYKDRGRGIKSFVVGSIFRDDFDDCDHNNSCSLICGVPNYNGCNQ